MRFDYESQHEAELSIKEGQVLDVLSENANGWWKAELNGVVGLIPFNFCERLALEDSTGAKATAAVAASRAAGNVIAAPTAPASASVNNATASGEQDPAPPADAPGSPPNLARRGPARVGLIAPGGLDELAQVSTVCITCISARIIKCF